MTVATVLFTSLIFVADRLDRSELFRDRVLIGGIVASRRRMAETISQDLKTGFLVGARRATSQIAI